MKFCHEERKEHENSQELKEAAIKPGLSNRTSNTELTINVWEWVIVK